MKVGDYVRTKNGFISEIININDFREPSMKYALEKPSWGDDIVFIGDEKIKKSSPNIIDLIEVGDYVNGVLVESIYQREKDKLYIHSFDTEIMMCVTNNNIETILTREMFESMEYKVGEINER